MPGYVFERQRFDKNGHLAAPRRGGKAEHAGYLRVWFPSRDDAFAYYHRSFPDARPLSPEGHSSLHAAGYVYVVRTSALEYKDVPPFDPSDEPTYTVDADGTLRTTYPRYGRPGLGSGEKKPNGTRTKSL